MMISLQGIAATGISAISYPRLRVPSLDLAGKDQVICSGIPIWVAFNLMF
jgi:hypothetical protein